MWCDAVYIRRSIFVGAYRQFPTILVPQVGSFQLSLREHLLLAERSTKFHVKTPYANKLLSISENGDDAYNKYRHRT
jgi:hypothetical protein